MQLKHNGNVSYKNKIKKRRDFTGDAENSRGVDYDYDYNDDTAGQQGEAGFCEHSTKPSDSSGLLSPLQ